jgi:altronate dehydratase small subunit
LKSKHAVHLNRKDNVAVAVEDIEAKDLVNIVLTDGSTQSIKALETIPFGFKIALTDIPAAGYIIKYGEIIGKATSDIELGAQVHVHNVEGVRAQIEEKKGE